MKINSENVVFNISMLHIFQIAVALSCYFKHSWCVFFCDILEAEFLLQWFVNVSEKKQIPTLSLVMGAGFHISWKPIKIIIEGFKLPPPIAIGVSGVNS